MKNTAILGIIMFVVIIGGTFLFLKTNTIEERPIVEVNSGDVQKIVINMKNSNYYPDKITVKAGQPVSITLDSTVQGCYRSFTIRDLGIKKYSSKPSETIDFTPTKKVPLDLHVQWEWVTERLLLNDLLLQTCPPSQTGI